MTTVMPESSFTLSWEGVISASRILGGIFIRFLTSRSFIPSFQLLAYPNWISSKIKDSKNLRGF
jgi:hypothetical protein